MRIALTGAGGQLGLALDAALAPEHTIIPLDRDQIELGSPDTVERIVASGADLVLHPAAHTHVDGCARDPALAYQINALGTKYVALACRRLDVPLVYISTNEVFAGDATSPYAEYDQTGPINAYGRSKLAGEVVVRELLERFYIVRVAWLFGGEQNFVRTVLRLAQHPPEGGVRMVADEVGSPTYSVDVAAAIRPLLATEHYGTYHFVNAGLASRYAFARAILDLAGYGTLPMLPIRLADYQRASMPPPYTPLANYAGAALGITLRPWEAALEAYLEQLQ
ncbi:dTDP-4-dehydrorhamnose reductase [Candidatus Viridilinea mediisalina]|uniref:dTDP-4-dehydrorhamnose reductase n=1 Tax=Candidatus Viridilinea mediisalina TaxID=2024553 RepID=A0A2A6RHZ3_9CHLR|nr:dTDP-4-dehydrorhamnose reductase [Candidatus Viridilinea mediisalina]PDW02563.1 dTDP-4-dehydrorhamnose reductase [Candidatus Viridilinea mediisalina]